MVSKLYNFTNNNLIILDPENFFVHDSFSYAFSQEPVKCLSKSITKSSIFWVDLNTFSLGDALADHNGTYRQYDNATK